MSALTPEQLNEAFLKHFMPETLYLIEQDRTAAGVEAPIAEPLPAIPVAAEIQSQSPAVAVEPAPAPVPPAAAVAAIPKLPKVEQIPMPKGYAVIGESRKGVVVLVTLPEGEFQALPQSVFLRKILAAIGFGHDDVAFVNNVSGSIARFEQLRETTPTKYIISFASRLDTDHPHEKFTLYNPVSIDGVPVVFSQSLTKLDGDQNEKTKLWEALKQMFGK